MVTTIGRYEVIRPLGRGGMGQVFLARDPTLERQVAIKLLQHESGPARDLLQAEAKTLAALSHPNIVTIFEIAEAGGQHYIAMEYLPGRSLRELLDDKPSRERVIAICAQVAAAVQAAHAAGILHRDIKPENIVVGDRVKVVDFGIARRLDQGALPAELPHGARAQTIVDVFTQTVRVGETAASTAISAGTQTVFGTPAYMAPEVLQGQPSSPASDVYSLGVMLHECLTGTRPYDHTNLAVVIARAIGDEPAPAIDDPLGGLIAQMLDRDPALRPSLETVARRLARLRSEVSATVPPRRRWIAPALAGIAIAAIAIVAIAAWRSRTSSARTTIAIRPLTRVVVPSYGAQNPDPRAVARAIAMLVETTDVHVIPPDILAKKLPSVPTASQWEDAARANGATSLATASIVEVDGKLVASLELFDLDTREKLTATRSIPSLELPELLDLAADWLVDQVSSGTRPKGDAALASKFLDDAKRLMSDDTFPAARTYAEEAVHFDRASIEGWELLARLLGYMQAPTEKARAAAARAIELAPDGPRKQILRAEILMIDDRYRDAVAVLEPLESTGLRGADLRDLHYQLGEAHWHQGHHDTAFEHFKSSLAIDNSFTLAASHAGEYTLARRRIEEAKLYLGIQHLTFEWAEFVAGNYATLAETGSPQFKQWSRIVLDRADLELPELQPYAEPSRLLRDLAYAAAAGNRDTAARQVDQLFAVFEKQPTSGSVLSDLTHLGEIVVVAGMADQTRRVLEMMKTRGARYGYRRLAIVASPLLGKPTFQPGELSDRLVALAAAYDAELAGDHATAAAGLLALIRDPTWEWEFPERVQLVRILRALGRDHEADEMCADTMRPVVVRLAFVVARSVCKR